MRRQPPAEARNDVLAPVAPNPPRTVPARSMLAREAGVELRAFALLIKAAPCVFFGSAALLPDPAWIR
jgi:hypothetical protein